MLLRCSPCCSLLCAVLCCAGKRTQFCNDDVAGMVPACPEGERMVMESLFTDDQVILKSVRMGSSDFAVPAESVWESLSRVRKESHPEERLRAIQERSKAEQLLMELRRQAGREQTAVKPIRAQVGATVQDVSAMRFFCEPHQGAFTKGRRYCIPMASADDFPAEAGWPFFAVGPRPKRKHHTIDYCHEVVLGDSMPDKHKCARSMPPKTTPAPGTDPAYSHAAPATPDHLSTAADAPAVARAASGGDGTSARDTATQPDDDRMASPARAARARCAEQAKARAQAKAEAAKSVAMPPPARRRRRCGRAYFPAYLYTDFKAVLGIHACRRRYAGVTIAHEDFDNGGVAIPHPAYRPPRGPGSVLWQFTSDEHDII